jgi:predicted XRE-type DNA-binding protein
MSPSSTATAFPDVAMPASQSRHLKSELVIAVIREIDKRGMTLGEAAMKLGIGTGEFTSIVDGHFRNVALDRIVGFAGRLGIASRL